MNKIVLIVIYCAVCVYIGIPLWILFCALLLRASNFLAHANIPTHAKYNLHVQNVFAHTGYFLHAQKRFAHAIKAAHAVNFLHMQGIICTQVHVYDGKPYSRTCMLLSFTEYYPYLIDLADCTQPFKKELKILICNAIISCKFSTI